MPNLRVNQTKPIKVYTTERCELSYRQKAMLEMKDHCDHWNFLPTLVLVVFLTSQRSRC
jgi:hypothetical protein